MSDTDSLRERIGEVLDDHRAAVCKRNNRYEAGEYEPADAEYAATCADLVAELAALLAPAAPATRAPEALREAFVAGAHWWLYHHPPRNSGTTAREAMQAEAERRYPAAPITESGKASPVGRPDGWVREYWRLLTNWEAALIATERAEDSLPGVAKHVERESEARAALDAHVLGSPAAQPPEVNVPNKQQERTQP